jgi:hypothetical protein
MGRMGQKRWSVYAGKETSRREGFYNRMVGFVRFRSLSAGYPTGKEAGSCLV